MRSSTLKWAILLATIIIALLVVAQLFWLQKIYTLEQKEFTTSVYKSIQSTYEDLELGERKSTHLQSLIEKIDNNTFIFKIDSIPQEQELIDNVHSNLEDFGIFTDCKLALYDHLKNENIYNAYLPTVASPNPLKSQREITAYNKNYDYIQLFFPHRNQYIINQMQWWIFSSIILIVVLIALGFSIFNLYKQKFLNEVQSDFISNVTHEFQTPLTTLTLGLDNIAKPGITAHPEKLQKYTLLMQGQVAYLKQHLDNLMHVQKADSIGLGISKELVDPNVLVAKAIVQLTTNIEEKKAVLNVDLNKAGQTINADENSLYMAILNVISNAIKYATHPIIDISTSFANNLYTICVKDNGIGIEKKLQSKLFKKFYRVPTGNIHNVKGLGLGLYFVKKIVDEHRGKIIIHSIPNEGTTFKIILPK